MNHVKVHYNSDKPSQLQARAYAQGSDIHVTPGQEKHLPHEAWHVVQQAQGRVKPTMQMKMGVSVNDDVGLEIEADVMGAKALQAYSTALSSSRSASERQSLCANVDTSTTVQAVKGDPNDPYEDPGSKPVYLPKVTDAVVVPSFFLRLLL